MDTSELDLEKVIQGFRLSCQTESKSPRTVEMVHRVPDPIPEEPKANKQRAGLGWEGDWYRDESTKCLHRDLVVAGMNRARQQGKRIGRPRVTERTNFAQRFAATVERIRPGGLSRRQVAKELAIGYATLKRLIDTQWQPADRRP